MFLLKICHALFLIDFNFSKFLFYRGTKYVLLGFDWGMDKFADFNMILVKFALSLFMFVLRGCSVSIFKQFSR